MSLVECDVRESVAVITLNDAGRRNAMSVGMADELVGALDDLGADGSVGAVVVTGTPPAFSAGADLDELEHSTRESLARIYAGFLAVARCPLPTVAAVNGPAVGAGINLALACDVRVASPAARFECRFLDLALLPGGGHTWMLRRLMGPQGAAAMVVCGEALDGEEAARRGLAWRCVPAEELLDEALRLAGRATTAPVGVVRRLKEVLAEVEGITTHEEAVPVELEAQYWSTRQPEFRERIAALRARIARRRS